MYKVDLHTHSEASKDGGITANQYAQLLENDDMDMIAITDHSRIDFALGMQKALGKDKIIVGEEIMTKQGEIIGLFLTKRVADNYNAKDAINAIKKQNGLVYIPHPFEKTRNGLQEDTLDALATDIDIIEVYNGRSLSKKYQQPALNWAAKTGTLIAASSDAHNRLGVGKTFTSFINKPKKSTFKRELSNAHLHFAKPPIISYLFPKINRIANILKGR